jgi:hypothetical protein
MRRLCFSLIVLLLLSSRVIAQQHPPAIEWQTSFGGSGSDQAYAIQQTPDGGYIVTGYSASNDGDITDHHGAPSVRDILVLRLDPKGKIIWHRSLGGAGQDGSPCLTLAKDGYIIAGSAASIDGDVTDHHGSATTSDAWMTKLDTNGKTLWSKSYGGSQDDGIIGTSDGGYLFAARSNSNDGDVTEHHGSLSNGDVWIVKIDSTGKIKWQKSFGGSGVDAPFALARTDDSAYVIAGYSNSNDGDVSGNHGGYDIWVFKIDDSGKLLWQNSFGSAHDEDMNSVTLTKDGGYIVGGSAYYSGGDITTPHRGHNDAYDIWIFKLHRDGKLAWEHSYGGTGRDYEQDVRATPDGGCLFSGYTTSVDGDVIGRHGDTTQYDGWIVKVDSLGTIEWQRTIGGSKLDGATGIALTSDGGCALACNSASSDGDLSRNKGGLDAWVVKLSPFEMPSRSVPVLSEENVSLKLFPNPASREVTVRITGANPSTTLGLYDQLGKKLKAIRGGITTLDVSTLPSGIYFIGDQKHHLSEALSVIH